MPSAPPDRRAAAAAGLLRRVFASLEAPLTFRLWDGTTTCVGGTGESGFAVVFRSRRAFRRIVRWPTSLRFGEAYIDGEVDIEGDIFAAMRAANAIERLRVREVREVPGGAEVASDAGTFTAGIVVGAGGHGCPVARLLGRARVVEHVVVTQESETRVGAERLRALTPRYGWPELIAEPDFKGYGWYFTKGDFLNIGVGALGGVPVRRRLERLLARLRTGGRLPDDLALTPFRGHAYAIRRGQPRRLGGERFALVGDAAGLARDVSGEGIGPAVRSACLAAEALLV